MALKFSQFTSSKVCSVIFNQSTYFWLTNVSRYGSCCLVRLKIDFANMFQAAEVAHAGEERWPRLVPEAAAWLSCLCSANRAGGSTAAVQSGAGSRDSRDRAHLQGVVQWEQHLGCPVCDSNDVSCVTSPLVSCVSHQLCVPWATPIRVLCHHQGTEQA